MGELLGFVPSSRRAARLFAALAVLWGGLVGVHEAEAADVHLLAAGDIASCANANDTATAAILAANPGLTIATLGDNAYVKGTAEQFANCYGPTWGVFKGRTRPSIGNHEYYTADAAGYFGYFGEAAGPPSKGWYSYDIGAWHVVVLNSNCGQVGCGPGSEQERWLRADLAAHANRCTLAYWHHPRFSSDAQHGNNVNVAPFWDALYEYGADLVLSGHAHSYERFAPQDPSGRADDGFGIRQIIVGTGGRSHYGFKGVKANSEVRNGKTYGVLRLTLKDGSYGWRFLPEAGKTFTDTGVTACHGRPPAPPAGSTSTTTATSAPPATLPVLSPSTTAPPKRPAVPTTVTTRKPKPKPSSTTTTRS